MRKFLFLALGLMLTTPALAQWAPWEQHRSHVVDVLKTHTVEIHNNCGGMIPMDVNCDNPTPYNANLVANGPTILTFYDGGGVHLHWWDFQSQAPKDVVLGLSHHVYIDKLNPYDNSLPLKFTVTIK